MKLVTIFYITMVFLTPVLTWNWKKSWTMFVLTILGFAGTLLGVLAFGYMALSLKDFPVNSPEHLTAKADMTIAVLGLSFTTLAGTCSLLAKPPEDDLEGYKARVKAVSYTLNIGWPSILATLSTIAAAFFLGFDEPETKIAFALMMASMTYTSFRHANFIALNEGRNATFWYILAWMFVMFSIWTIGATVLNI